MALRNCEQILTRSIFAFKDDVKNFENTTKSFEESEGFSLNKKLHFKNLNSLILLHTEYDKALAD